MTGADLRCPKCGAGAKDVGSDFDLDDLFDGLGAIAWTCLNGHQHISGVRDAERGFEQMPVREG